MNLIVGGESVSLEVERYELGPHLFRVIVDGRPKELPVSSCPIVKSEGSSTSARFTVKFSEAEDLRMIEDFFGHSLPRLWRALKERRLNAA